MDERDKLINKLIEEKGGTSEQYLDLLNSIAYHESAGTFDPKLHQYGGGPGRGKYQFEVGKNKGAITAARRLKSYYKDNNINIPNWLNKATKDNSLDVTELTPEQQDLLFLGNMRMHPKADLANIFNGKESIPEFWAKYHWAGNKSDRSERLKSFNSSYENYKNSSPEELLANIEQDVAEEIDYREPLPTMVQESTRVGQPMNMNSLLSYIKQNNQPQQQPQSQPQQYYDKELNHYNGGGTHQQNPLGGIPQGNKSVEANETSFKLPQGKFIFSDRISINGQMQPKLDGAKQQVSNSYNNQFAYGGPIQNFYQDGGGIDPIIQAKKRKLRDERYNAIQQRDNTYIDLPTVHDNISQPAQQQLPKQPMLSQDNRTESQRKADYEKAQRINNASVGSSVGNMMKAPLLYLNNPMKLAGDLGVDNWLRGLGATKDLFPTTDEDYRRYQRIKERTDISDSEKINMLQNEAYGLVPDAAINTAFSVTGANSLRNAALQSFDPIGIAGNNTRKVNPKNKSLNKTDDVVKTATSSVDNINKKPWQLEELPGLHLKSTMEGEAISKIVDKTGKINTEQALAIIRKESGGADKVALIKQGLGDNIPKKMDYNEFRKVVQDQLIPLETKINPTGRSEYGLRNIGYDDAPPMDMGALTFSNKSKFGRGSYAHGNPEETLGHAHFLRDAETPDVLTVTQIQSDAFQGPHRIMPKVFNKEQHLRSFAYMEDMAKRQKDKAQSAKQLDDNIWEFPDGSKVHKTTIEAMENLQDEINLMKKAEIENFPQKQLLDKNHQERYLQELVDYAGKRGDVNKVRVPTSETAAKIQGYYKLEPEVDPERIAKIKRQIERGKKRALEASPEDKVKWERGVKSLELELQGGYEFQHQTILKKYSQQPKTIKKLFGVEPKVVTDNKGNSWYEFDIPKKFKEGKGEIKAFGLIPAAIGTSAAGYSQFAYGGNMDLINNHLQTKQVKKKKKKK